MATKVKTAKKYRKEITKSVSNIHCEVINISDELVEGTITTATKWQKLWAKAIKNSEPIVSKQMDIMYDTLKTVKGQLKVSGKRMKTLVTEDLDMPTINVKVPTLKVKVPTLKAKATAKKAVKSAAKTAKKVVAKTKAATPKAKTKVATNSKTSATAKRKSTATAKRKATATTKRKSTATAKRKVTAPRKIRTVKADNLKLIEGVGPKLETILLKNGIITFNDLSKTKVATLRTILEKAGPRYNMHNPTTWAKQARFAAKGQMTELKKYQATLNNKK